MKGHAYHTALGNTEEQAEPCQAVKFHGGEAFVHDIHTGLPAQFAACDVIYGDPPWRAGFAKFNARAGVGTGTFQRLTDAISAAILQARCPVIITVGKPDMRRYPKPDYVSTILLRGAAVQALYYGFPHDAPYFHHVHPTSEELIELLARKYSTVGDFLCGYGNTGRIFVRAGKRCVLADFNARCIGHIAAHNHEW